MTLTSENALGDSFRHSISGQNNVILASIFWTLVLFYPSFASFWDREFSFLGGVTNRREKTALAWEIIPRQNEFWGLKKPWRRKKSFFDLRKVSRQKSISWFVRSFRCSNLCFSHVHDFTKVSSLSIEKILRKKETSIIILRRFFFVHGMTLLSESRWMDFGRAFLKKALWVIFFSFSEDWILDWREACRRAKGNIWKKLA